MVAVIGIDPSIASTGVACPDGRTFTSKGKASTGDARLVLLRNQLGPEIVSATLAVIEDLPANAMGAGLTGRAQGVVRELLQRHGVPYAQVAPATLKKFATGKGDGRGAEGKQAMRDALEDFLMEDLPSSVDDNQVDAWWLRQMGLARLGEVEVLPHQVKSLAAVKWGSWGE